MHEKRSKSNATYWTVNLRRETTFNGFPTVKLGFQDADAQKMQAEDVMKSGNGQPKRPAD